MKVTVKEILKVNLKLKVYLNNKINKQFILYFKFMLIINIYYLKNIYNFTY